MPTDFCFRLNGTFIPEINVGRALIDGQQIGELQLSVRDSEVGWFTIEDSPDYVLEYRDQAAWELLPFDLRRGSTDKGWNRATPQELIGVLWVAGVIK